MKTLVVATFVACSLSANAFAADGPLTKPEVDAMVATPSVAFVRDSDQKKIEYALHDGHANYASSTSGGRNLAMSGTYEATDAGPLCFKGQAGKHVNLPDGCYAFRHEGDKVLVAGGRNAAGGIGEVVK